jgi:hypothetical protein
MGRIVIDASIAASWCFRDEATDYTEAALKELLPAAEQAGLGLAATCPRIGDLTKLSTNL